ncbi:MAG: class II fructose-bisphosphatase [Clostridiales bacterium]|nr:class II fructose-bisphosphatase [Clostridiales bacterium]
MITSKELSLPLVRVTEAAALRAARTQGQGDKNRSDKAAVDAMRGMLDYLEIRGTVVIGEGEKDEAPMLYCGEVVGMQTADSIEVDIAVDPIDGTTLISKGLGNSISVIAMGPKGSMMNIPCYYALKLACGPKLRGYLDLNASLSSNIRIAAARLGKSYGDITVALLNRPRHDEYIKEIRSLGCRIKLIQDGDIAAAIATCDEDKGIDFYYGIGGAPEAVITAVAIKALEGDFQVRLWPSDPAEEMRLAEVDLNTSTVYTADDLAKGDDLMFSATGITDGELLPGVRFYGPKARTYSLLMRTETKTVRYVNAIHNLDHKTLPSRELQVELQI